MKEKTSAVEKHAKIASIKINFEGNTELPGLNRATLDELGVEDKPVLLKKNILEKTARNHPELPVSFYKDIIGNALYNPDGTFVG